VEQEPPLVVQEGHRRRAVYDPWGLELVGITGQGAPPHYFLWQGKEREYRQGLELDDFDARAYEKPFPRPQLGRWHAPGLGVCHPANQFASPYLAMGNRPVEGMDPDGRFWVASAIGAAISGALYTVGVATSQGGFNNWDWKAFGGAVVSGAIMGAVTGGVSSLGTSGLSQASAKGVAAFVGGAVNMMNQHDAKRGFGLHSLGYFAAGAVGAAAGVDGLGLGILMGGTANVLAGHGAGNISSGYGMAQHFVGGALSAVAGRQLYRGLGKVSGNFYPGSDALSTFADRLNIPEGIRKGLSYGSQNVASRFAYTDRKYFTGASLGNHLLGFAAGAGGGYLQYKLMLGDDLFGKIHPNYRNFSLPKTIGLKVAYSTLSYGLEYAANTQLTYGRQNWKGYFDYKAHSYLFKSWFYGRFLPRTR
jgi:hypothetical protein